MKEPLFSAPPGWTRRRFLKGSTAALAGVYGLSRDFALAEQVPDKFDGLGFKLAAPEPNAKSGGVLRMGIPNRPPHFDIHQSGTFFNHGAQGCMFDNLVRRDPRADGRGGTRKWHNRPGLSSTRPSASQTLGASHPANAAAIAQYRMQSEDDGRIGVVRRHQKRKLRFGDRCHRFDPARPSDYFNAWYTKDGPQNYSFWDNKEFQALVPRIDREVDAKKRLTLIRRAESVMEQDPPLVPVAWEKINDVWYNYVMDHNPPDYFGIYGVGQTGYSVAGQGLRYCSSPPRKRGSRSAAEPWIPEFPLSRE
jgi:hypothetical protein